MLPHSGSQSNIGSLHQDQEWVGRLRMTAVGLRKTKHFLPFFFFLHCVANVPLFCYSGTERRRAKRCFWWCLLESITRVSWFWFSSCAEACFHTVRLSLGVDEGVARQLAALAALSEDLSFVPSTLTTNQRQNCSRPPSRSNFGSWECGRVSKAGQFSTMEKGRIWKVETRSTG